MSTDAVDATISSDLKEVSNAAKKLAADAVKLGGLGFSTTFLQWFAAFAAMHDFFSFFINTVVLFADPGSNQLENKHPHRTSCALYFLQSSLTALQFLQVALLSYTLGQVGKWIAFIAVILRLFCPQRFPDWLELPAAIILIIVVAPSLFADTVRGSLIGALICLVIGCYLLQEHIQASGGFRNSFTQPHGISNTVGIILLLVYPVWALICWNPSLQLLTRATTATTSEAYFMPILHKHLFHTRYVQAVPLAGPAPTFPATPVAGGTHLPIQIELHLSIIQHHGEFCTTRVQIKPACLAVVYESCDIFLAGITVASPRARWPRHELERTFSVERVAYGGRSHKRIAKKPRIMAGDRTIMSLYPVMSGS
ncbi:Cold-regulated 413 plasma membrane protein 2-like protein [Drosera capensis]